MDINQLNPEIKALKPVWVNIKHSGTEELVLGQDGEPVILHVIGLQAPKVTSALFSFRRNHVKPDPEDIEGNVNDNKAFYASVAKAAVVGWSGNFLIDDKDTSVFSVELLYELIDRNNWIAEQVFLAADDSGKFSGLKSLEPAPEK